MKISIITPSFNQSKFLSTTLNSVLEQTHPDYEHIIFDPGSTDGSIEIAKAYCEKSKRAKLHLKRDRSQTSAINIGFNESSGDILCWLNSDDHYATPETLSRVHKVFSENPSVDIVYGRGNYCTPEYKTIRPAFINRNSKKLSTELANCIGILQPSLFIRKEAFLRAGNLDEKMHYSFDYEYWARCAAIGLKFHFIDELLSVAVIHPDAKTIRAREVSLREAAIVAKRYYGFISLDWVKRITDQKESGADGITASSNSISSALLDEEFARHNNNEEAIGIFFNNRPTMNAVTHEAFRRTLVSKIDRAYLSAWDSNYFDMGLTLIASIHKHDPDTMIFVCDIGMKGDQLAIIRQLKNVILLDKDFPPYIAEWQRNPKNYIFKNIVFNKLANQLADSTLLLWIDAGVKVNKAPNEIWDELSDIGHFFINHDDSRHWPLYNASFTSNEAIVAGKFSLKELVSGHVCSCLYGLKVGTSMAALFKEAAQLSNIKEISVGDKHPSPPIKVDGSDQITRASYKRAHHHSDQIVDNTHELRTVFGYYGHRQDQAIISNLAARYGAKISSAKHYCPATELSSEISKENWNEGVSARLGKYRTDDFNTPGVTHHHRGLVKDFEGIHFSFAKNEILGILGNGPSLASIPFNTLTDSDTIGMNAAYRHWKSINWFPTIYCCLDTVVGMSHKNEILDLVRNKNRYGIKQFLLRDNLVQWLLENDATDGVINFDIVREGFKPLHPEPVTTGSHSLGWGLALGYKTFFVAGVDCNYVEHVKGAVAKEGNVLEITDSADNPNPNYFFSGYQQVGDRYNIPNPSKDLHIRSWRNIASLMTSGHLAFNVSTSSRMDALPIREFDSAIELLRARSYKSKLFESLAETPSHSPEVIHLNANAADVFHNGNNLLREKYYSSAIAIYLHLHGRRPLNMYETNALYSARKIGIKDQCDIAALRSLFTHVGII